MSEPIWTHSDSIDIAAPPEQVYAIVTAMERYGEWSSENCGGYWRKRADGSPCDGAVGDVFVGVNRAGDQEWKAPVEVVEAEPNSAYAFVTGGLEYNIALWRYSLDPAAEGTRLTESYELRNLPPSIGPDDEEALEQRKATTRTSIRATLEGMKAAAEQAG